MTSPRRHTWICLYFGNDADCATCHPQATCKNCGHTANQHSFTDAPITFGWCPKCRGCGPAPREESETVSEDWAEGHDMKALPPDPLTAQRYFNCDNCGARGHVDPNGITSGDAAYQSCSNPKES